MRRRGGPPLGWVDRVGGRGECHFVYLFPFVPTFCSEVSYPELCAQRTIEVEDFFMFASAQGKLSAVSFVTVAE
jgi:hypothetical protein